MGVKVEDQEHDQQEFQSNHRSLPTTQSYVQPLIRSIHIPSFQVVLTSSRTTIRPNVNVDGDTEDLSPDNAGDDFGKDDGQRFRVGGIQPLGRSPRFQKDGEARVQDG